MKGKLRRDKGGQVRGKGRVEIGKGKEERKGREKGKKNEEGKERKGIKEKREKWVG
jgi:hypothetical protein